MNGYDLPSVGPHGTARPRPVVVSSVSSDSHTWNLVYLQLVVQELGHPVVNLGPCVPDELLIGECAELRPSLVVISSVNGNGYQDGRRLITSLRRDPRLATTPVVIGGKLGISGGESQARLDELRAAGFDEVFEEGTGDIDAFRRYLETLPTPHATPATAGTPADAGRVVSWAG
ncbi:cobalamin-dependent protein [Streptomyces sp. DSM 44915]|uniref:Cobalamin-dependent protein n=1 Tax=Streptomyces chisholmiae TaxID=3075540 RepID=A0ABU2JW86_9ACTN|nr:cobalamin-dependent protein [Streptomyces sp. DSM 44915]MDT0269265.1 cobalamin-dependent protein [Streptomyces sp. DSM 44915]